MINPVVRCSCNTGACTGHLGARQCSRPATRVVIFNYQHRSVRVATCEPCANWWLQTDSRAEVRIGAWPLETPEVRNL